MTVKNGQIATADDFTAWATWTPTFTGFSANPASGVYRYITLGAICIAMVRQPNNGTSNATGFTISAPVTAATVTGGAWTAWAMSNNNSAATTSTSDVYILSAGSTFTVRLASNDAGWTNSGGKSTNFTIVYEIAPES